MGHSIREYLERRSADELRSILFTFQNDPEYDYCVDIIKEVLNRKWEDEKKNREAKR